MAGAKKPMQLNLAVGGKHWTKAEIEERLRSEVQPCTDDIVAPSFLTAAQKRNFDKLAGQLEKIKIMGETDVDALARYISAQSFYEQTTKELRKLQKERPKKENNEYYYTQLEGWTEAQENLAKLQDRYFKQAHTCASALGLTISSRCKLEVPVQPEAPKQNKFAKFGATK